LGFDAGVVTLHKDNSVLLMLALKNKKQIKI
jgi:hypothetical protein